MSPSNVTCVIAVTSTGIRVTGSNGKGFFVPGFSGPWAEATPANPSIQRDLNATLIRIEEVFKDDKIRDEDIELHIPRHAAEGIARSAEYHSYIQGAPDALAAVVHDYNPNRKHCLAPYLYGVALKIEGCRYPHPELVRLVQSTGAKIMEAYQSFRIESQKLLNELTEPLPVIEDQPEVVDG